MAIRDGGASVGDAEDGLLRRGEASAFRWDDLTIEDESAVLWISPQTHQGDRTLVESGRRWLCVIPRSQAAESLGGGPLLPAFLTGGANSPNRCGIERGRLPGGSLPLLGL